MELKLNVYKNKQIEKIYTAETYDLMFGTVEDLVQLIDLDSITQKQSDADFIKSIGRVIGKAFDQIKPLMQDIFPGLTGEELRRVKVSELIPVVIGVLQFTIQESFTEKKR